MGKSMRFNAKFQKDAKKPGSKKNSHLDQAGRKSIHESKKNKNVIKEHGPDHAWPFVNESHAGHRKV